MALGFVSKVSIERKVNCFSFSTESGPRFGAGADNDVDCSVALAASAADVICRLSSLHCTLVSCGAVEASAVMRDTLAAAEAGASEMSSIIVLANCKLTRSPISMVSSSVMPMQGSSMFITSTSSQLFSFRRVVLPWTARFQALLCLFLFIL